MRSCLCWYIMPNRSNVSFIYYRFAVVFNASSISRDAFWQGWSSWAKMADVDEQLTDEERVWANRLKLFNFFFSVAVLHISGFRSWLVVTTGFRNVQKIFHSLSELASTLYRNMRWGGYQGTAGVQIASCWMCSALNGVWTVLFRTVGNALM